MPTNHNIFDITIIGGGPVGLFAAYYASLRQVKVKVIESLSELGGQPAHLFPEKIIYDIPGQPQITGIQLTYNLILQSKQHQPTFVLDEEALSIEECLDDKGAKYFKLETNKQSHYTRTIIIAAGNGAFSPKKLNLPEATQYEGKSLHYYVPHLENFRNKTIAICGGGDSAIDWALMLEGITKQTYLIHRRPNFRAHEESIKRLMQSSIEVLTPYLPIALNGQKDKLQQLVISKNRSKELIELNVDDVIVSYGFNSSYGQMKDWGLEMERGTFAVDPHYYQTSHPGIFAIGDSCYYQGKVKLIATGFGEAPQAVNGALLYINPEANIAPIHSTQL